MKYVYFLLKDTVPFPEVIQSQIIYIQNAQHVPCSWAKFAQMLWW